MSHPVQSVAEATRAFVDQLKACAPARVEAKVASGQGMPLLCAVEAALAGALPAAAAQELVWLGGSPGAGAHELRLRAYGAGNELLAEAAHAFGGAGG